MNVNKVFIGGRLTRDPDVRTTQSGQQVATLGVATNHYWTDRTGQKQEKAEFHNIVLWGKLAEIAGQYLTKGSEIFVEGRLQSRSFVGKDGVERKATEIVGETMQMVGRREGGREGGRESGGYDRGSYAARPQQDAQPKTNQAQAPKDDDIPTINLEDEKDDIKIEDVPF